MNEAKAKAPKRDYQHNYTVPPKAQKYESVTRILDVMDKSNALVPWAVRVTCDFVNKGLETLIGPNLTGYDQTAFVYRADVMQLVERARKSSRHAKEDAADVGTVVHRLVEQWCSANILRVKKGEAIVYPAPGDRVSSDERVQNAFDAFSGWAAQRQLTPLESENIVWSDHGEYTYAGTLDILARMDVSEALDGAKFLTYVLDFKTSNGFWSTFGPQIAAYRYAYEERHPEVALDGLGIVRLDKDTGMPEFKDYTADYERDLTTFMLCKDLFCHLRRKK